MKLDNAVDTLAALANVSRLMVFRTLAQAGPQGLPAGEIAARLGLAPSSLSFHLKELVHAGLADGRQEGRSIIYAARYEVMNELLGFLTDNCCGGNPCSPVRGCGPAATKR